MSIHSGHRQRMKERFLNNGLDAFQDHEILELLLFYCIPRCDTNVIAHRLIDRFGSLVQVVEAPVNELETVEGVGASTAAFIRLLGQTHRHLAICERREKRSLQSCEAYGDYLRSFFEGTRNEVVYLLCLDSKAAPIDCRKVSEGSVNCTNISFRKILDIAISSNAATVVLAHNHPGGLAVPSKEDVQTTGRLAKALYMADIMLTDHIVIADGDYISLYQSGLYDPAEVLVDA